MSEALAALRAQLDDFDRQLIDALAKRFEVTRQIGAVKRDAGLPLVDESREREIFARYRSQAEARSIDPDLVEGIYRLIVGRVRHEHAVIADAARDEQTDPSSS